MYIALRHENIKRSNRTFMELKHRTYQGISTKYQRSNRTFMELKLLCKLVKKPYSQF